MKAKKGLRQALIMAGLLLISGLSCAAIATGGGAAPVVEVSDSRQAVVTRVQVDADEQGHLRVNGQLRKRYSRRGPVYGRLRVSLLDVQGTVLHSTEVPFSRRGHDTGRAYFSQDFALPVSMVGTVRVTHLGLGH